MILFIFSLFVFVAGFFFQSYVPRRIVFFRLLVWLSCVAIFVFYLALVFLQYRIWREAGPPSSFLLPPHKSISYVFYYHFFRFLLWYCISFFVGLFFFLSMRRLNARSGERFFEREEPYLAFLTIFLLGNPAWNYAWVYHILFLGCVAVIVSFVFRFVFRSDRHVSLYRLWIPVAIGVIITLELLKLL